MDIRQALTEGRKLLQKAGVDTAALDASILLSKVTSKSRTGLIAHDDELLSDSQEEQFFSLIDKRCTGYPVAYITGIKEFFGLSLKVTEDTLIPRPATETLVEEALKLSDVKSVLDLGTGSGAIILALKSELPSVKAYACDLSEGALKVARENARNLGLEVTFFQSFWFDSLPEQKFSLIVSNPPYIEAEDEHLNRGALPFEPLSALSSGEDGLDDIRKIVARAPEYLEKGGCLMLEHGYNQGEAVREIMKKRGFCAVRTVQDLEGIDRVCIGMLKA